MFKISNISDGLGLLSPLLIFISGYMVTDNLSIDDRGVYANFQIMIGSCAYWTVLGSNLIIPKYHRNINEQQINTLVIVSSLISGVICNIIFHPSIIIFLMAYTSTSVLIISTLYLTYSSAQVYYLSRFISQIVAIACIVGLFYTDAINVNRLLIVITITNMIIIVPFYLTNNWMFSKLSDLSFFIKGKTQYILVSLQLWMLSAFDKFIFIHLLSESDLGRYVVLLSVIQIPITFSETLLPKVLNISLNSRKAPWVFIQVYIVVVAIAIILVGANTNYILGFLYGGKYAGDREMIFFICSLVFLRSCLKIIQEPLKLVLEAKKLLIINSFIILQAISLLGNYDFGSFYAKFFMLAPLFVMMSLSFYYLRKTTWST